MAVRHSNSVEVKVNQYNFIVTDEDRVFNNKGSEITNETIRNKALVKRDLAMGTLIKVKLFEGNYAVLKDDRIISLQASSAGREIYRESYHGCRKRILAIAAAQRVYSM